MDVMVLSQSDQVMHVQIFLKQANIMLFCSVVYAANYYISRRSLWDSLKRHSVIVKDAPWVVLGDFNSTLYLEDRSAGASKIDVGMHDFKDCVEVLQLVDVNRVGIHYTWSQKPTTGVGLHKKIDRIMANGGFIDVFPAAYASFQPARISDHSPCILKIPMQTHVKCKPFNFLIFWFTSRSFRI